MRVLWLLLLITCTFLALVLDMVSVAGSYLWKAILPGIGFSLVALSIALFFFVWHSREEKSFIFIGLAGAFVNAILLCDFGRRLILGFFQATGKGS
jgi:hypothetical protein